MQALHEVEGSMDFRYPPEAEEFRQEVRAFFQETVTPDYLEEQRTRHIDYEGHGRATQRFVDQLRERGYLTLAWPKEYGGQGRSIFEQAVFHEEMARAGATDWIVGHVGLTMAGPALMVYGTEEQKRELLPKIASGEINFCQLFTEPGAGSDLASLQTRAVADGDDFIVNGSKIFTTWAFVATHGYLLARTDPGAPKHRGISVFMLDMKAPGVDVRPLHLVSGSTHGMVSFENVRISRKNLIGELNRGWYHAMVTFSFERAGMEQITRGEYNVRGLLEYARTTKRGGQPLAADPAIRQRLVVSYRNARLSKALGLRVLDSQGRGLVAGAEANESSLHSREAGGYLAATKALVYGMYGQLLPDTPYAENQGDGARSWWGMGGHHAGGTIEIQKNIIAQRGLGLPR
jgi:alkylation response protein AidB-like acyl-CoA dehydrogenase